MKIKTLGMLCGFALLAACATETVDSDFGVEGYTYVGDNGAEIVYGSIEDFNNKVQQKVYFGFDSSTLDPDAIAVLKDQAVWLQAYPGTSVVIEGHCDERGTREYNLALGERRASAVRNYLVSQGIAPSRISTISYGKERPEDVGSGASAWAANRRAVTVVQ